LHDVVVNNTDLEFSRNSLYGTYIFLALATLVVFSLSYWVSRKNFERAGLAYMGFSLLKMMAFVLYLLPALKADDPDLKPIILQQLVVYLLFLAFEAGSVFRLLGKGIDQEASKQDLNP
jgi:hypothetical protein